MAKHNICVCLCVCEYMSVTVPTGEAAGVGGGVSQKFAVAPHPSPHAGQPHGQWQTRKNRREEGSNRGREIQEMEGCQCDFPLAPTWSSWSACCTLFVLQQHLNAISWKQTLDYHKFRGECIYSLYGLYEKRLNFLLSLNIEKPTILYIPPCRHMCLD